MRAQSEPQAARALQHSRCRPHAPGPHPPAPLKPVPPGFTSRLLLASNAEDGHGQYLHGCHSDAVGAAPPAPRCPSRGAVPPAPQPPRGVLSRPLPIPPAGTGSASAAAFRWERDVTAALFDITQPRKPRRGSVGTLAMGSSTPWCLQDRHGRDDVLSVSHCHSGEKNHCPSLPPPWENKPKHVTDGPHLRKI